MIDELILIRHGQTVNNVAGITQGWNDSELSETGLLQVQRLAERLARHKVDQVHSSPLGRALATANAIASSLGLTVATDDDLREMHYGDWEGRSFLDIRRDDADIFRRWMDDPDICCPGGESHSNVRERVERAIRRIAAEGSGRVAVVSHGTALRIAVTALLGIPVTSSRLFAQDNAAFNLLLPRGERFILKVWNDTTHCG